MDSLEDPGGAKSEDLIAAAGMSKHMDMAWWAFVTVLDNSHWLPLETAEQGPLFLFVVAVDPSIMIGHVLGLHT